MLARPACYIFITRKNILTSAANFFERSLQILLMVKIELFLNWLVLNRVNLSLNYRENRVFQLFRYEIVYNKSKSILGNNENK